MSLSYRPFDHAGTSDVRLRDLRRADAHDAARLHCALLPHGLFTRLGSPFLAAYYRTFADSPHAVARVAVVDGDVAGVLVGSLGTRAHYRWVLRHRGPGLAARGVAALTVRPGELWRFSRTRLVPYTRSMRRLAKQRAPGGAAAVAGPVADLTHVVVAGWAQGRGVGRQLVTDFEEKACHAGSMFAQLLTLSGDAGAGGFYLHHGWQFGGGSSNMDGEQFDRYTRRLR